ncbi:MULTISPECIES: hypothetical protein [unclassified Crossiella]|uniref:hypothetical protein n=1 Tax=unclassified Crossiella TaxID=2620835 RepID=UPI001FFE4F5A|nr:MULTISPECIES: hypothetical protein [unclassified Crossiella]MCK2240086.1 hypothetical protein [Crossiella sp. S99.2]MCK2252795.1 hypothetical protein [Crossiella sp. S99.1]
MIAALLPLAAYLSSAREDSTQALPVQALQDLGRRSFGETEELAEARRARAVETITGHLHPLTALGMPGQDRTLDSMMIGSFQGIWRRAPFAADRAAADLGVESWLRCAVEARRYLVVMCPVRSWQTGVRMLEEFAPDMLAPRGGYPSESFIAALMADPGGCVHAAAAVTTWALEQPEFAAARRALENTMVETIGDRLLTPER